MIPITVIRHPKERRSKCSLRPLEARSEITFHRARPDWSLDVSGFTILALGAPELSPADAGRPLLLLDSTWRLLPQLETCLRGEGIRRTLPAVPTAYPRVSKLTADPSRGWLQLKHCIWLNLCWVSVMIHSWPNIIGPKILCTISRLLA